MNMWRFLSVFGCLCLLSQTVVAAPKYIGNEKCGSCHKIEFTSWELSAHGKAFNILKPGNRKAAKRLASLDPEKDYTGDKKCVKCHVTGYRKRGGFKNLDDTPEMIGVGCESCHGPGGEYKALHEGSLYGFKKSQAEPLGQVYGQDDEGVCRACHEHEDAPHNVTLDAKYEFDWKEKLKKRDTYHVKKSGKSQFAF